LVGKANKVFFNNTKWSLAPSPTNQPTNKQTNKATKQPTKTPKKTLIGCFTFCPCNFVLAWALPLMAFFFSFQHVVAIILWLSKQMTCSLFLSTLWDMDVVV
jgi:hypothetical protein